PDPGADGGAHRVGAKARAHAGAAHTRGRAPLDQAHEEALPADLDEALRAAARGGEEPLPDAGGKDDRGHRPRTSSSAPRKRSKSAVRRCPMLATRKMSRWSRPCPS